MNSVVSVVSTHVALEWTIVTSWLASMTVDVSGVQFLMVFVEGEAGTLFACLSRSLSRRMLYKSSILQLDRFASCFEDGSILM